MAIAYIGGAGAEDATIGYNLPLASPYTVTAGSLLVAAWRLDHAAGMVTAVTDDNGNTWQDAGAGLNVGVGAQRIGISYAMNANAGATTVNLANSTNVPRRGFTLLEFSGVALTSALEATDGAYSPSSGAITSGGFTTAGEAVGIAVWQTSNQSGLGFTAPVIAGATPTAHAFETNGRVYSRIIPAGGSYTFGLTQPNNVDCIGWLAAFSVAGGGPPPSSGTFAPSPIWWR